MGFILGTILAVAYLAAFWIFGAVLPRKWQSGSVPAMCMCGFLLYFSLFQIIALPMKLAAWPLHILTVVWGSVCLLVSGAVLWKRRDILLQSLQNAFRKREKRSVVLAGIVLSVALAIVLGLNTNVISYFDASYYIGLPVSSVYSNTLNRMSPYTGLLQSQADSFYILNTDTLQSAVIYQAFNIHPLIERKWSFTIVIVLVFQMAIYHCGKSFWKKEYGKRGVFCLIADGVLLFSYSIAGASHYFAYRTYEGKAITSFLYTTIIFSLALAIYKKEEKNWTWCALFLCGVSGVCFCNTALFVIPVMIATVLFPYMIGKKRQLWMKYLAVLSPCVVWIVLYKIV